MYPSDLTGAQWVKLEPLLNPPRGSRASFWIEAEVVERLDRHIAAERMAA
jgi:hypothetical protein